MPPLNPQTLAQAVDLGAGLYELILANWGNRGTKQDASNGSIQYPPVVSLPNGAIPIGGQITPLTIQSLSAIAISPRSDIDRCILHFVPLPQAVPAVSQMPPRQPINQGFVNQGGILETEQRLSINSPLIAQLVGPIIIRAEPAHWYGDTYRLLGGVTETTPFGTAVPVSSTGVPIWVNPELRLLLYVNRNTPLPPPVRAPFHQVINYVYVTNAEETLLIVPIMGRKSVRVAYRAGPAGASIRLTGTFHYTQPVAGPAFAVSHDLEVPLADPVIVPANDGVVFHCGIDHPDVSYMLVKATSTAAESAFLTVDAFD